MLKKPGLLSYVLTTLFCILSVSVMSTPAFASPRTTTASPDLVLASKTLVVSTEQAANTAHFWTPERMKVAKPMDVLTGKVVKPEVSLPMRPTGKPGSTEPAAPKQLQRDALVTKEAKAQQPRGYPFPFKRYEISSDYTRWPYTTEGKVFYHDPRVQDPNKGNFVCSGTILNSNNKSVVDTAGHCVVEGGSHNVWWSNWMFCPAYKDGRCPLGVWTARQFFSDSYWSDKGWPEYDYGAAVINPDSHGNRIVNVLGGQGASWNFPRNQFFSALGYPQAAPFDGKRLIECDASYATDLNFGTGLPMVGIGCDMTGGSSGGPWYRDGVGGGHRNGHNDWKLNAQPLAMYSPYYGNDWHNLVFDPAQHA